MKTLLSLFLAAVALTTAAFAGGKSAAPYVGIHAEGEEYEGPKMVRPNVVNGTKHYFRVSPEVVTRHFEAFRGFVAEDGASYGAALKLTAEGERAMAVMCTNNQGRLARTIVNGKALDVIRIDRAPQDGYFIVWSGLGQADLKLLSQKLKRLDSGLPGEEVKPAKKKR